MKQYLDTLKTIQEKGTYKPAARENMPGTQSYFGHQFRHDLSEGFPLLTTKKMFWKGVVIELLWFLRGDTNIKYLVDNGVNIWNEDAFNYYEKVCKEQHVSDRFSYNDFISAIKENKDISSMDGALPDHSYTLGDCGFQYGRVWRRWEKQSGAVDDFTKPFTKSYVDQVKNIINSLKKNPESRRHLITAIDPAHENDLALYWCHAMFQFNCRPLTYNQRLAWYDNWINEMRGGIDTDDFNTEEKLNSRGVPKFFLDCQLYQRSADVVLGVPFNIASYALLTHILSKICNMIPGEFIHTFGDVHIYDNHKEAVEEQLQRTPTELPIFEFSGHSEALLKGYVDFDDMINNLQYGDFHLKNYNPQSSIKAELSTGLKK